MALSLDLVSVSEMVCEFLEFVRVFLSGHQLCHSFMPLFFLCNCCRSLMSLFFSLARRKSSTACGVSCIRNAAPNGGDTEEEGATQKRGVGDTVGDAIFDRRLAEVAFLSEAISTCCSGSGGGG